MISLLIPVFNEEDNIVALHDEISAVMRTLGTEYEIVYVDDGSTDNSPQLLRALSLRDAHAVAIQFTRHFGQTEAMQAALDYSRGEIVIFLDGDRQNDPQDIPRLLSKMAQGYDVVSGWRKHRKDPFFTRRLPSSIANVLIAAVSKVRLHDYGCSLKAYKKEMLKEVRLYSEMHRFIPIYAVRQGARIAEIEVHHRKRGAGRSKYNLLRIFKVILDFFVAEFINNYLNKPMYIFGSAALVLLFLGGATGIFIVARTVFWGGVWVSPLLFVMTIFIILGFQFILMGLLAEISIRLYFEGTARKTYTVRMVSGNGQRQ